jgi:uncharacterized membrane protein
LLALLGFLTAMLSLIFIFPLLAHASWHACRDMVQSGSDLQSPPVTQLA